MANVDPFGGGSNGGGGNDSNKGGGGSNNGEAERTKPSGKTKPDQRSGKAPGLGINDSTPGSKGNDRKPKSSGGDTLRVQKLEDQLRCKTKAADDKQMFLDSQEPLDTALEIAVSEAKGLKSKAVLGAILIVEKVGVEVAGRFIESSNYARCLLESRSTLRSRGKEDSKR